MTAHASYHHYNDLPQEVQHGALLQLLSNSLVLSHFAPYLSCNDLLSLAATSRAFRYLVHGTPQVWKRVDLRPVKAAQFDIDAIDHGGEVWRNVQVDENVTEDDFYSGPLRGIFSNLRRGDLLRDVQVLVLDGLSVTAELVHDILIDPSFSVRILSIREAKNLNERKLCAALAYACRMPRPDGMPKLRGLYVFGPKDANQTQPTSSSPSPASSPTGSMRRGGAVGAAWNNRSQKALAASLREETEAWYTRRGEQFPQRISAEWASTLLACEGAIAFDAVLCTGPRHFNSPAFGTVDTQLLDAAESSATPGVPPYSVATHSLDGCAGCGAAPEGWTVWGEDLGLAQRDEAERRGSNSGTQEIGRFPLLAPPPLHSANIRVAMCPAGQPVNPRSRFIYGSANKAKARFIPRCAACLRDRYCSACNRWWCETCYIGPWAKGLSGAGHGHHHGVANTGSGLARVSKSCFECGMNCRDCIDYTQRICRRCRGCYCLIHNEGSDMVACDCTVPP